MYKTNFDNWLTTEECKPFMTYVIKITMICVDSKDRERTKTSVKTVTSDTEQFAIDDATSEAIAEQLLLYDDILESWYDILDSWEC